MKSTKNRDRNITHFLYVLPNLIMYSFLSIVPIVLGLYYSFTNWNGIGKNYKKCVILRSRFFVDFMMLPPFF